MVRASRQLRYVSREDKDTKDTRGDIRRESEPSEFGRFRRHKKEGSKVLATTPLFFRLFV